MAVIETWLNQDLQKPVKVQYIDGSLFSNNGNGNRIGVELTNNGESYTVTGTVSGYAVLSDGTTVPCTGSKSGNKASILVPPAAYLPGNIFISVFVTDGTTVTTVAAVASTVVQARTDNQVDPGSVVTDWTQTINGAMQDVETAAENLGGIIATPYASLTFPVPLGKYTYYNDNLYRCISPIASSETFTPAHWAAVKLGDDVSELKSAFKSRFNGKKISIIGDSIDTFDQTGYKIDGYRMYYPQLGVTSVEQTWWKQVIDASGAQLEINASWSGSRVTDTATDPTYPDFYDRVGLLGSPDLIFVTLGTNDSSGSVALGQYDFETPYGQLSESEFRPAYIKGVKGLIANYPDADIVCISQKMDAPYSESIQYIAEKLGALYIDASNYKGESGVHPGVVGMRQIASNVLYPTSLNLNQMGVPADSFATGSIINDITDETDNNIIAFTNLYKYVVNGVTVSTTGNGIFNLSGTCNNSGGRTLPLTDVFHLDAGTYTFSMYTGLTDIIVSLCDAPTREFSITISTSYPSVTRTKTDGDYYVSFNFINGKSYNGEVKVSLISGSHTNPPFEKPITANDIEARKQASINSAEISTINEKIHDISENVTFEQGTVSGNGALTDNPNRIRTKDTFPSNFTTASVDSNHRIWAAQYDENGQFLRIDVTGKIEYTPSMLGENTAFVRFVVVNVNNSTPISPSDETGFSLVYGFREDITNEINEKIDAIDIPTEDKNKHYSSFKDYAFILNGAWADSDATIVGSNYVIFGSGDDELTESGSLTVNEYANGFENSRTSVKQLYHRFGHCNSVDYSPVNDCLIMGNGSGSYTLQGKIYIIPNFSDIVANDTEHTTSSNPLTLSNTNAIVIDCSSYDLGTKFNVIWGELNNKKQDVAYLITAKYGSSTSAPDGGDNGTIRRLLLGTGTNQLDYGSYSQAASGEFNGTFNILNTYTQDGTAYAQCNQGCCYYNGKIYSAIGHDGLWLWEMWLDSDGNKIWYDEYKQTEYNADGSVLVHNSTSVCKSDKYIFFGQASVGVLAIPI